MASSKSVSAKLMARGPGPEASSTEPKGNRVAQARHTHIDGVIAFVTREPDGLYYTWRQGNVYGDNDPYYSKPHWYLAFKSKAKALGHMHTLAGVA